MTSLPYTDSAGRLRAGLILLLILLTAKLAPGQDYQGCPHVHGPSYVNPLYEHWLSAYDVSFYELDLTVSNTSTHIQGSAGILIRAERSLDTLVLELNSDLEVEEVMYQDGMQGSFCSGGTSIEFVHEDEVLYMLLPSVQEAASYFRICIRYAGDGGKEQGFFSGLSNRRDYSYNQEVTYTLSEPMNARDWFPVKQVLEDKIDSVTFHITCENHLLAVSNGVLTGVEEHESQHTLTWHTAYPMAYYLLSFAVAVYREYTFMAPLSAEGDSVLVQNFIYDDSEVLEDWEEGIRRTADMIHTFSTLLVDYPFSDEKYGHAMAPMGGGMEHQTMTTLQNFGFFLVAHELAHQWFGDYVTCGNWQDIWINEGFASYFEYVAAQEILGQESADSWMDNTMSLAMRNSESSVYVPADEVEDNYRLFSTELSYKKGAVLLHMIRYIIDDDEQFFRVLKTYLHRFGNSGATGEDFRQVLEEESGIDFSCFFEQWYYGAGYPGFLIRWEQSGDSVRIHSEQYGSNVEVTPFFRIPFELELVYLDGRRERIRILQDAPQVDQSIPASGWVRDIRFDPDRYLLATSSVTEEPGNGRTFRMGPNPFSGDFHIQFPRPVSSTTVRVTSYAGLVVHSEEYLENPISLDLSHLSEGAYVLELRNELGSFKERIVRISSGK